jgi:hypothetical protein
MSKQDIEKRLGFAAQGVKAEMGSSQVNDSATTADLIREAQRLRDVIKTSNREFDKTNLRQIKQELDKRGVLMPYGASEVLAARPGVKAKFGRFSTDFSSLAKQIPSQPDLAKKSIIALAKKMGKEVDITRAEFEQLMQYAAKLGMETQVANAHDDVRPGFSRTGAKGKFVRIVTTPQGRYTTNLDKNTRAPIEGGKGYVMVDPAQYITPKRVRVQGTKGEIEVRAVLDGKEIVGVSAKLVSSRPGMKAKMAFPSASTASSRTEELLRKELSRIAGEGYIQYKGRSKINTLKSKSDFLQMIGDLRSHLAPLQKKWVSKSEQEQDAAGSLEASSALNTISGALKKLDQLTTMANGVTTAARPSAKAKA